MGVAVDNSSWLRKCSSGVGARLTMRSMHRSHDGAEVSARNPSTEMISTDVIANPDLSGHAMEQRGNLGHAEQGQPVETRDRFVSLAMTTREVI